MIWGQVEDRWNQLMVSAKENWNKLSDDDLQQVSGKREELVLKIEEAYGITRRQAEKQVWDWGKSVEHVSKKIA